MISVQGRECHELERDTLAKHSNGDILDTDEETERDQVMQYSTFVIYHPLHRRAESQLFVGFQTSISCLSVLIYVFIVRLSCSRLNPEKGLREDGRVMLMLSL